MKPDASLLVSRGDSPRYIAALISAAGMTQKEAAAKIGVSHITVKSWCRAKNGTQWPYSAQYALEQLVK